MCVLLLFLLYFSLLRNIRTINQAQGNESNRTESSQPINRENETEKKTWTSSPKSSLILMMMMMIHIREKRREIGSKKSNVIFSLFLPLTNFSSFFTLLYFLAFIWGSVQFSSVQAGRHAQRSNRTGGRGTVTEHLITTLKQTGDQHWTN